MDLDILEKDVGSKASVWRSPVMPGGLFAMDREYYWELGGYDPEIRYYGAEHVEMSFRIWMCGGTLEVMPCSNIGHIYREFDRFGVDRQLKSDIGKILDRNDARVAEVWMDDYKELKKYVKSPTKITKTTNVLQVSEAQEAGPGAGAGEARAAEGQVAMQILLLVLKRSLS
ncbi:unnamed protein product, partial [Durusdinium trenchii]